MLDRDFWRGRRVLVTGHTGFKGSWLALWLRRLGAEVTGYALEPPSDPSLFDLAGVGEVLADERGDIRDLERFTDVLRARRPEIVLHLAAQSLVREGYAEPVETFDVNLLGTVKVLDAVRRVGGVAAVVVATTDKCYENQEWAWGYRETDRLGGRDPYAASKACAELAVEAYARSFLGPEGIPVATARAGNVIGGGDWGKDRLLPDLMSHLQEQREVRLRSPGAVRPWQHVLEPLAGYLCLAERLAEAGEAFGGGWNFGPVEDDARPVAWIAERLAGLWGRPTAWPRDLGEHPHEAATLRLDASKARRRLGWEPRLPLDDALAWIVEWYRGVADGATARSLCETQIDRYLERMATAGR